MPAYAFEDCDYLEEVIIPDSVITLKIGSGGAYFSRTFCGCSNLKVVKLGNRLTSIPSHIPSQVLTIIKGTFDGCENLSFSTIF